MILRIYEKNVISLLIKPLIMRIRRKFLQLTRHTVPYGNELKVRKYLPKGYKKDEHGNYYITVGENFTTMFTCHMDTACSYNRMVNHVQVGQYIGTDGKTILGADDKAGMVVLLYMIEKQIPGLYYFFIGEEVGCIGSTALSSNFLWPDIMKVVSFDRRGTTSVITEQMFGKCCSDEFATSLSNALNSTGLGLEFEPDNTGILTDSAQFVELVPECTNISVGYYDEHTTRECQDIHFLAKLCRAVTMIDWESLPIVRDVSDNGYDDSDFEDSFDFDPNDYHEDYSTNIIEGGISKKMYISKSWINEERKILMEMLKSNGYNPRTIIWDGNSCWVEEGDMDYKLIGSRTEISEIVDSFGTIPYSELRENIYIDKQFIY